MDLSKNSEFSILRGSDLYDMLLWLEEFYLEYRNSLNFSKIVTFGCELEVENFCYWEADKFIHEKEWKIVPDGSLDDGCEIISPKLYDKKECWKQLKNVCQILKSHNVDTCRKAGGHIHVGAQVLGDDYNSWRVFLKLWCFYEGVLFRFFYGDKKSAREEQDHYASPFAFDIYNGLDTINRVKSLEELSEKFFSYYIVNKYYSVYFGHVDFEDVLTEKCKNTIEFRCPNASDNEVIWQNNVNCSCKMLSSCRLGEVDEEFIDYKLLNEYNSLSVPHDYNEVNLKYALEFVDLVFNNNLDKLYFLKQYIKNFESNYGLHEAVYANKFVK